MTACMHALCNPGETILCEEWTYTGIRRLADLMHLKIQGVPMDDEGVMPGALRERLKATGAKVIICTAAVQNPTTATMSLSRRREIMATCAAAGAVLVEDDIYGILSGEDLPPLAALDPSHVVHISSLSKCLASGMRLGSVVAPERLLAPIANALISLQWTAPSLWAELFAVLLENNTADRCVAAHRKEAQRRLDLFADIIGVSAPAPLPSYHVWHRVPAPWRCEDFVSELLSAGVRVSPAQHFAADREHLGAHASVRICLGGGDDIGSLKDQLIKVRDVMRARPRLSATIA